MPKPRKIYGKIEIKSKHGVVFAELEPASDELKTCTVKEETKEIKKEVKTEYFYILYEVNGVFRLADFGGSEERTKSNTKNWNEKGMKATVITGSQLNQLKSSK